MASVASKSKLKPNEHAATPTTTELVCDSLATGVVFALILTVGQRVIGFVRGILFCYLMTDQQLGQWSMVWSFLMLLAPLAMLGLPGCFGKYSEHFRQRGQLKTFVSRIGAISLSLSAAMSLAIICFPEFVGHLLFRDPTQVVLVRCLGVALFAVSLSNFGVTLLESLRQVRIVTVARFIIGVGFALIGTSLLMIWDDAAAAVSISYAVCCLIGLIPGLWLLRKYQNKNRDNNELETVQSASENSEAVSHQPLTHTAMWKKIAPFAMWLWVSNMFNNCFEISDRYMLIHFSGTPTDVANGMVGQYHSGRVVPLLLVSVAAMLAGVLLPYMSAAWEEGKKDVAKRQLNWTIKIMGLAFTLGGVFVLLCSPILFDWILQGRYNDGLAVLPLTLVYCIWFSLFTVGQDYLWVAEKGKLATLAIGIGLAGNLLFNFILIPHYGLSGAVIATTIGNFLAVTLIFTLNHSEGCKTDIGIWLAAIVPLVLLLPQWIAILILVAIAATSVRSKLIFNQLEKKQIKEACLKLKDKIPGMAK